MNRQHPKKLKTAVINLRLKGMTLREIARITSIPLSTVNWWISHEQKKNPRLLTMREKQS